MSQDARIFMLQNIQKFEKKNEITSLPVGLWRVNLLDPDPDPEHGEDGSMLVTCVGQ
jgi:hypothetical protein